MTIAPGRGSSEAITRLATGASDIGSAGIGALMSAKAAEGVPVTAVMSLFNRGPHAFYTLEGNGIEDFGDVAGKRIATSPFTESNIYLPLVLEDNGMAESDVEPGRSREVGGRGVRLVVERGEYVLGGRRCRHRRVLSSALGIDGCRGTSTAADTSRPPRSRRAVCPVRRWRGGLVERAGATGGHGPAHGEQLRFTVRDEPR